MQTIDYLVNVHEIQISLKEFRSHLFELITRNWPKAEEITSRTQILTAKQ